jgi:tripartite-type tricarboxylate transporter receptor subunit TctC
MMFSSPAVVLPHVRTGRMRALAVSTPGRFAELPGVPTMAEQGMPDFDATAWYGLFAPAGTPREIVSLIAARIDAIVRTPEVREIFRQAGLESAGGTPEAFDERVRSDIAKWAKVARAANVKVD